ncbi:TonB-dependent receptor [Flagellimonas zhangzhouensis]|uniref:Iron complex outermembrane recepter protein n=1 Tax=Flagellimonas zhangzhouensis TaxID=1073328 RepID=A0A1H2QFW2_9FLAO|nr:TonB-dependent receptor [Allomuricauda zhangzhouensis]SDQ52429.1 iron complex outermembrane recepter protein [Allomuricauda zhangzhouensis]SDW05738.1 iron complex outermembrane recepter protein [Allomuricauda zhangzhouensis]
MKHILLILSLAFYSFAQAQSGNITGKVTDQRNNPLANVNIAVSNTSLGTNTDYSGAYKITDLAPGSYTLTFSMVGFGTQNKTVTVYANQTTNVQTITLVERQEQLNEVVVEGDQINKYARKASVYVSKMPLKDIENPQVYNSISTELLQDQVVTNFDDALKNAPGIDKLWESTGRGNDGAGYFSLRGFAVQPTMINGLPGLTNGSPDPANVESIEVIKGPSGTLYGSSLISYGGLININTKKPFYGFGGNISYTSGSYGLNRVSADVNSTLGNQNNIALRVNTSYHTQNSYQDAGFRKSFFFAPSLAFQASDRLSFNINTEFYNGRSTNQTMLFVDRSSPLRVTNLDELGYDYKRSYTSNDLYIDTPTYSLQGQMNYILNDSWTSQTVISRSNAKSDGYYSYLYEITSTVEALSGAPIEDGIILARYTSNQNSETLGTDIQQNFIGDFNIGNMRNRLVVGLDYFKTRLINNSTGYGNQGFIYVGQNPDEFQAVAPALHAYYGTPMGTGLYDSGVLTQAGADAGIATLSNPGAQFSEAEQEIFSAYASNVINLLPELSAMASLRVDRFSNDGYNQTAFSPKFGVVYQPILNTVSIFANYMNGFSNVAPVTELSDGNTSVRALNPEHANQFEVGAKLNLFNDKLSATFSYYDITVSDMAQRIDTDADNYYYTQDGEQTSKGFEASLIASPVDGLNIVAGYSYNDSELVEGAASFTGFRPESAGPMNLVNVWASYRFTQGALENFGLGFGGNYASENKIFNRTNGTFTIDEYTILNASTFYEARDFRITLKLDNIANKDYYKGWSTISPQNLRSLSANFTYKF